MNSKEKKVSYDFTEDYKSLPLKVRAKMNLAASELLEFQRKNAVLVENTINRFLDKEVEK